MKSFKEFKEAYGDKHQEHDIAGNTASTATKKKAPKSKKDIKLKGATLEVMPKHPDTPDKALGVKEEAPPGKKYERMVKHIKKSYAKDGKLTKDEKSIAYATAWKNKNKKK